jgi:hypothetical protein
LYHKGLAPACFLPAGKSAIIKTIAFYLFFMSKTINRTNLALEFKRAISRKAKAKFFPDPKEDIHRHSQYFRQVQNFPVQAPRESKREIG